MDAASLIYTVSKDLYLFYQKANRREDDIKDIRTQLLWMVEKSVLVQELLQREGVTAEDTSKIESNLQICQNAVKELTSAVAKLKTLDQSGTSGAANLKPRLIKLGVRTAWPLKRKTIVDLGGYVRTCHDALDSAMSLLHMNISASNIEKVRDLDKTIMSGKTSLENALDTARSLFKDELQIISRQLVQQSQVLAHQAKLLVSEQEIQRTQRVLDSLKYDGMEDREHQIEDSKDITYVWIFTHEAKNLPEVQNLVNFLNTGSGLFWISGEAASGKSTFMKSLARPQRTGSDLWQWNGNSEFIVVRHFCFVAGLEMQKTQLGLLRTLLFYLLKAEPGLVPDVCPDVPNAGLGQGPWSVRDLRGSLQRAVQATSRRLCIFDDGLDEIYKESELEDVVRFLKQIASYGHVKLIISSRPWRVFRGHCAAKNELYMKSINTRAIVSHLKSTLGSLPAFLDVSWQCQSGSLECEHTDDYSQNIDRNAHGTAHRLIFNLLYKAQGNFLWIYLISKSIRSRLDAGLSMASTIKRIDETPSDLNTYFREMILKRLDKDLRSETAMALRIALLPDYATSWISFWQLLNHCNGEAPSLEHADFSTLTPYQLYDRPAVESMIRQTGDFLDQCGRDLLDTRRMRRLLITVNGPWKRFARRRVIFTHRTAYDFLKTRDMDDLLNERTPRAFRDENFPHSLLLSQIKLSFGGTGVSSRRNEANSAWRLIEHALNHFNEEGVSQQPSRFAKLAKEADAIALHYLVDLESLFHDSSQYTLSDKVVLKYVCYFLACHGCYGTIDTILERWPAQACSIRDYFDHDMLSDALRPSPYHYDDESPNLKWLRKLLAAGADPNRPCIFSSFRSNQTDALAWSTTWCRFLDELEDHTQGLPVQADEEDQGSVIAPPLPFSSPSVRSAIKLLLEFGADLQFTRTRLDPMTVDFQFRTESDIGDDTVIEDGRIDPLAILRARLPMDADSEWPSLLEHYLKPETRQEIQERRQKILERWPPSYRPEALAEVL